MRKNLYQRISALLLAIVFLSLGGCGARSGYPQRMIPDDGPSITEDGIRFSFFSPKVKKVNICGEFNNWSTTADPLYDREGNGMWTILLPLPPGRYEYKFVIDGVKWVPDPGNPQTVDDGFGGANSVIVVE